MIDGRRFTQLMCQTHTILTADQLLYNFLVDIIFAFPNQSRVLAKCSACTFQACLSGTTAGSQDLRKWTHVRYNFPESFSSTATVFDVLSLLWKQILQHMGDFGGQH